jgi:fibronectin type 3 domain-containing protein
LALVAGTSYKDETVQSGTTYYYVTRAVDAKGNESVDSNVTTVVVP